MEIFNIKQSEIYELKWNVAEHEATWILLKALHVKVWTLI